MECIILLLLVLCHLGLFNHSRFKPHASTIYLQKTKEAKQIYNTSRIFFLINFRAFAESIQRPFGVRYNPYTQSVEVLSNAQKITALVRELRGDICIVSSAIKKISAQDSTLDVETIANMLHTGLQVYYYHFIL